MMNLVEPVRWAVTRTVIERPASARVRVYVRPVAPVIAVVPRYQR